MNHKNKSDGIPIYWSLSNNLVQHLTSLVLAKCQNLGSSRLVGGVLVGLHARDLVHVLLLGGLALALHLVPHLLGPSCGDDAGLEEDDDAGDLVDVDVVLQRKNSRKTNPGQRSDCFPQHEN